MTLHEALRTFPSNTQLKDLYHLFGVGNKSAGELLTKRDEKNFEVREYRGKKEIAPVGGVAILSEV